jgi:hypothetical protein
MSKNRLESTLVSVIKKHIDSNFYVNKMYSILTKLPLINLKSNIITKISGLLTKFFNAFFILNHQRKVGFLIVYLIIVLCLNAY